MDGNQHISNGNHTSRRRCARPKQLDRNRTLGYGNSRFALNKEMGCRLRNICPNLHVKHKRWLYYQVWLNAIRVAINIPAIIYLFKALFDGKFK